MGDDLHVAPPWDPKGNEDVPDELEDLPGGGYPLVLDLAVVHANVPVGVWGWGAFRAPIHWLLEGVCVCVCVVGAT